MHHNTRDVLSEAAYLARACELLAQHIKRVEDSVFGTECLTSHQEGLLTHACTHLAAGAKDHIEMATQFVDSWHAAIEAALHPNNS